MEVRTLLKTYSPAGRCIYCETHSGPFSDAHIIPYALGGKMVLPRSSCAACAATTSQFELKVARGLLGNFRVKMGLPTRKKKERPTHTRMALLNRGTIEYQTIPIADYPHAIVLPFLPMPRLMAFQEGRPPTLGLLSIEKELDATIRKYGLFEMPDAEVIHAFYRTLAKIAHSFAVAELSAGQFPELQGKITLVLEDYIRTGVGEPMNFIGSSDHMVPKPDKTMMHRLQLGHAKVFHVEDRSETDHKMIVTARLFEFIGAPEYVVIVGTVDL